jgi:hypothetical protein
MTTRISLLFVLGLAACTGASDGDKPGDGADDATDGADGAADGADGTDAADGADGTTDGSDGTSGVDPAEACRTLELPIREYDATGPTSFLRRQPAGDFSVPLRDGTTFTLSEQWSGCDSYLFVPHYLTVSDSDRSSFWFTDLRTLLRNSPENVHYFFVVTGDDAEAAEEFGAQMELEIAEEVERLNGSEEAWWSARLHVVAEPSDSLTGLVKDGFDSNIGLTGFGIDRSQQIRGFGYFSAVNAYDAALDWPWEWRLSQVAREAEYFNFEAERDARLAEHAVTEVEVFGGDVIQEYEDGTLTLPDAVTMATFDTLELDILMECPDTGSHEIGNCGAWDYLAHMYLWDAEGERWLEMGRFITTYHRESRWVVDATHALAWLKDGGERTIRYSWAPSWNVQPTGVTLKVRLSDQGKGYKPDQAVELFTGGSFNAAYNDRDPVAVSIPADAARVELRSIISGHGQDGDNNCAEFCKHGHTFAVGASSYEQVYSVAGTSQGCELDIGDGVVPNQAGTWWFGRGGWCPGQRVKPWIEDVTGDVTAGAEASFSYQASLNGDSSLAGSAGNIVLSSWAVIYK